MSKYIDADKLIAEIDRQEIGCNTDGKHPAEYNTCKKILDIIASLRQEQPKKRLIQVKCLYPYDESWQKNKVYTCEVWHHGDLNRDFWDVYYDYGKDTKYVQFPTIELLNEEFAIIQEESQVKQEQPEVDLEKEIARFALNGGTGDYTPTIGETARHFYELGCRHVSVLYDDIEYERQRREAEEKDVDFDAEYAKFHLDSGDPEDTYTFPIDLADYKDFARHFYELGLNARKEEE